MSAGRITEGMLGRRLLADLHASTSRLATSQRQIASGKRIEKPSDDALGTHTALRLRGQLDGIASDQRSISDAQGWLDTTEGALADVTDIVQRARELALKGVNGTLSQSDRNKIADEVEQLIESTKSAANANFGGRYVFSGTTTDQPSYLAGAVDTWQGDTGGAVYRQIGPGISITVNVRGEDVFGNGGGDGKLLSTMRSLVTNLRSGNVAAISASDISALSANLEDVTSARGVIGALSNRVESASNRLAQAQEATTSLLSETEDTDIAAALIDFNTQQTVYKAALQSGQALVQPSLLDFLR